MKIRPFKWKCVILQRKIVPKHLHQNNNSSIEADMKVEINKKRLEYLLALYKMSVDDLLEQFALRAGKALDNDRILFSKVETQE